MRTRERLSALFPWPFVGVALLLVVLILVTPNLISGGPPRAGSLGTAAEFIVDRTPNSNVTHVYVQGLAQPRYTSIRLFVAPNVTWPHSESVQGVQWVNATNATDVLVLTYSTGLNPVAFNVTAVYTDTTGARVIYVGAFEVDVQFPTLYVASLMPGLTPLTSETLSPTSGPLSFLLLTAPAGTVP